MTNGKEERQEDRRTDPSDGHRQVEQGRQTAGCIDRAADATARRPDRPGRGRRRQSDSCRRRRGRRRGQKCERGGDRTGSATNGRQAHQARSERQEDGAVHSRYAVASHQGCRRIVRDHDPARQGDDPKAEDEHPYPPRRQRRQDHPQAPIGVFIDRDWNDPSVYSFLSSSDH